MSVEQRMGAAFAALHPAAAARVLERFTPAEGALFLGALPVGQAAPVVARMAPVAAAGYLEVVGPERAAAVLAGLPATSVAGLLRQLPDAEPVLRCLPEPVRAVLAKSLRFAEGTAGALADPAVLTIPQDASIAEAKALMARVPERVSLDWYVVDREGRLVGTLDLRHLLAAAPSQSVASRMRRDPAQLSAQADLTTVAADPGWTDHDALPVVDDAGSLVGEVRHQTMRRMARRDSVGALTPLVNLAELYWTGFSHLMFGPGRVPPEGPSPPSAKEGSDAP